MALRSAGAFRDQRPSSKAFLAARAALSTAAASASGISSMICSVAGSRIARPFLAEDLRSSVTVLGIRLSFGRLSSAHYISLDVNRGFAQFFFDTQKLLIGAELFRTLKARAGRWDL